LKQALDYLKARRKLIVGILMVVTLVILYSAKTAEPLKTFAVLAVVVSGVIVLEVLVLRILVRQK